MAKICMVGTGYVGLVSGACFADFGHDVTCVDIDPTRIRALEKGLIPFYEPGLEGLVLRNRGAQRLRFTTSLQEGIDASDVVFIAVQTPSQDSGAADLSYVLNVGREIGALLRPDAHKVIVTKSTVPVGTARKVAQQIRSKAAVGASFDMASNPEFLREGSSIEDFMRPDRVVIGADNERAERIMRDLYKPLYLLDTPMVCTTIETAELIKYACNSFLAVKISYINEMANLCESLGADVSVVAKAMGLDRRIGPKFLHAGLGFGGSCLPKDTRATLHMGEEIGESLRLVKASIEVNDDRAQRAVRKLEALLGDVSGKTIALLGLAFKPNTDDIRDAASQRVAAVMLGKGARVRGVDPAAKETFAKVVPGVELFDDAYACMDGADAVMLITEWNEFRRLDLERVRSMLRSPVFVDCRNVYDRGEMTALGFQYDCFGR